MIALVVSPRVAGAAAPDWTVNPAQFEFSATVTAQVELDGIVMGGEGDLLAAFVGDELRGVVAPIQVLETWMYFLTAYANEDGEVLQFRVYVADQDSVVDLEEAVLFRISGVLGDPQEPLRLRATPGFEDSPTEVDDARDPVPESQRLLANFPNPFNGSTRIEFVLTTAQQVQLVVYNLAGQRVRLVLDEARPAGLGAAAWDGRDDEGRLAPSGVYVYALHGGGTKARKLVLLR